MNQRWYDKYPLLAKHFENLRTLEPRAREKIATGIIRLINDNAPDVLARPVFKAPSKQFLKRWYDKEPLLKLALNAPKYLDEGSLRQVMYYLVEELECKIPPAPKEGQVKINVNTTGDLTVVSVDGNLLRETGEEFENTIEDLVKAKVKKIVLDLAKCEYISSVNLSVLLWAKKEIAGQGGDVKISGAGRLMAELLKRTSLDQIFGVHGSVEEAVRAFGVEGPADGLVRGS